MPIKMKYLWTSVVLALLLCFAQIMGSGLLILFCLASAMVLIGTACVYDFTLPVLLFFLPWSPIMRLSPESFSWYTFALIMVCGISVIKKRLHFQRYHLVSGIILVFLTLLSKLIDGSGISFAYLAFMVLLVFIPVAKEEALQQNYDFYQTVSFFSTGIIIAALCALSFASSPNIRQYIRVDMYLTITRRSGFYGDANFYAGQITAALSGVLFLILQKRKKKQIVWLGMLVFMLIYCGFLSGSKSFALVSVIVFLLWIVAFLRMRGRTGLKIILLISVILIGIYVATSVMFSDLVGVIITRFSSANNMNAFTTGRIELWEMYIRELLTDIKVCFLGRGFTNVKINGRVSHNTILQSLYQFGVLGAPFLLYWSINFLKDNKQRKQKPQKLSLHEWIVIAGAFMPWLAIDVLFFDEFFLLQWYLFIAIWQNKINVQSIRNTDGNQHKFDISSESKKYLFKHNTEIIPEEDSYGRTNDKK